MFSVKLNDNEKLVAVFRQTEWVLAKTVLLIFAVIYIPWSFLFKYDLPSMFVRVMALWSVICLIYFLYRLILWFINCTIVTDKKILLIHYPGLFHRILEDFELSEIYSITIEKKGLVNNLFDIGQVIFSLKNHSELKIIKNLKAPEKFKESILNFKSK